MWSLGEPASSRGKREVKVVRRYRKEVGAPGRSQVGGEQVQVGAKRHVGGAEAPCGQGKA